MTQLDGLEIEIAKKRRLGNFRVVGNRPQPRLFPAAHALSTVLEGRCKGVHSSTEKDFPSVGSASIDKLNRPDTTAPVPSKDFSATLLACKQIWDREIVFTEDAPESCSCKQVTGVLDWSQHFAQSAKKDCLIPIRPLADEDCSGSRRRCAMPRLTAPARF